jgi:hypothetical protein
MQTREEGDLIRMDDEGVEVDRCCSETSSESEQRSDRKKEKGELMRCANKEGPRRNRDECLLSLSLSLSSNCPAECETS